MNRFNFAVMALLCFGQLQADGAEQARPPSTQSSQSKKTLKTSNAQIRAKAAAAAKAKADAIAQAEENEKYEKLIQTMQALSEILKRKQDSLVALEEAAKAITTSGLNSVENQDSLNTSQAEEVNEDLVVPEEEENREKSAAKIAYKNKVKYIKNAKTGKKQSKIVSQDVVITLSNDFFKNQDNEKTLKFSPNGDNGGTFKITYEKDSHSSLNTNDSQVALADDPLTPAVEIKANEDVKKFDNVLDLKNDSNVIKETNQEPLVSPIQDKQEDSQLQDVKQPAITPADTEEKADKLKELTQTNTNDTDNSFYPRFHRAYGSSVHIVDLSNQKGSHENDVALAEVIDQTAQATLAQNQNRDSVANSTERPVSFSAGVSVSPASSACAQNAAWTPICAPEPANVCEAEPCCNDNICIPTQLNLGYTFGKGIETNKNYATANLMLFPGWTFQRNVVPFLSLSAHRLDNNKWAGSFGAGARWQPEGADCLWGFNVFYDTLKRSLGTYQQVGVGAEWLSYTWEARVNAYLPVGTQSRLHTVQLFDNYIGDYYARLRKLEDTYHGFDAELGYNTYFCKDYRLYAGFGPAWFENHYHKDDNWAIKGRLLLEWSRFITLEARGFKETHRNWHFQGAVFITIPFECMSDLCSCGLLDLFERPVYRNALIKSSSKCCWETNY